MNQVMRVNILGATFADVEGNQHTSVFVGQKAEPGSRTARGVEVMKMPCDVEVFHALDQNPDAFPMEVDLHFRLKRAGGGRMGQHCTRVVPIAGKPAAKVAPSS